MQHVLRRVGVFFFLCFFAFPVHSQEPPDPPGSLSATPGDGQVTLDWTIPNDNGSPITHYEYRQRVDEDDASWNPDWTTIPSSDAQTTSYTIAGLTNGITYRFRVRAVNEAGASGAARTKATPATTPDPPGSLSATLGDEQVTLAWTAPADNGSPITHYEYRQRIDEDDASWNPDWTTIPSSDAQTTSYTIAGLTNGTTYRFRVRAVNAVGEGEAARTKATPVQPNRPPMLDGPSAVTVEENSTDAVGTYTATDPDGDSLTWLLTGTDASAFELRETGTGQSLYFQQPPDFETQPTYTVEVVVTDDEALSATMPVSVTVSNVDEPGTVALSSTQPTVGEPIKATLADPDGGVANVGWTWSSGSGTSEGQTSTLTPTLAMVGTRLQATATYDDGQGTGKSAQSAQTEAVIGPPDPPGSLAATPGDEQVTLAWTTPADNGSPITHYAYRQSADGGTTWGPDWTTIPSSDAETTSFTIEDLTNGTEYTFEVRAVNAVGEGQAARTKATPVQPNRPPTLDGPSAVSFAENSTDAVGTYTATDPDGDSLTWLLTGRDASAFELSGRDTTRTLYFQQAPDFETQPTYTVEVVVTDAGSLSATVAVSVTVSNVDEPGTIALSSTQPTVGEPITATLTDPDGSVTSVEWTWSSGPGTSEGLSSTLTPTQAQVGTRLQATATYDDGHGLGKSAQSAQTEAVIGPPDPPGSLSATPGDEQVTLGWSAANDNGSPLTHYAYRQSDDGGSTWDPDWTTIPNSDAETTSFTIEDLTNGTEYTFEVRAVNAVGEGQAARTKATPVSPNRPPTLDGPRAVTVKENSADAVGTYTATDPDGDSLTWSLTGTDAGAFRLDDTGTSRSLYFQSAPDFETQPTYTVEVVVTDDGLLSATVPVAVTVSNVDEPGTITLSTTQPTVGKPLTATLADPDGGVTNVGWRWSSGSATSKGLASTLNITPALLGTRLQATATYDDGHGVGQSAQSVQTEAVIDRPAAPEDIAAAPDDEQVLVAWTVPRDHGSPITHYEYRLSDDGGTTWDPDWTTLPNSDAETVRFTRTGLTNGIEYTFEVRAVNAAGPGRAVRTKATPERPNRPPVLEGPRAGTVKENSAEAVGPYTASDPEEDALRWLLRGTDALAFRLDGTGPSRSLHFQQPPDFETQPTYTVDVVVSDGSLSATVPVSVTVSNVDEPGTVVLSTTQPRVGKPLTATLADPDGRVANVGWTWRSDSGASEGQTSTLTPTPAMVGTRLQATATYDDGQGTGKSAQSAQTEPVIGPPASPGSLAATPGDERVLLGWTPPADHGAPITHYAYRLSDDGGTTWDPDWTTIPSSDAETTSYTLSGLTNGTEYTFAVRAVNAVGAGLTARVVATPGFPVRNLSASPGDGQVVLDWAAPASDGEVPITRYEYRYSSTSPTTWTDMEPAWSVVPGGSSARSQTVLSLTNGTEYTFAVRAVNAAGAGEATRTTATPATVPEAVVDFEATASPGQVGLDWAAPASDGGSPITGYEFRYGSTSPTTWTDAEPAWAVVSGGSSVRGQIVAGLTNGTAYTFAVRAVNAMGKGAARRVSATPDVSTPGPVRNLKATPGNRQVTLGWAAPLSDGGSAITYYQYQRSGGNWTTVSGGASARRKTVSGLTNGTTYTFYVRAVNRAGGGAARRVTGTPVKTVITPPPPPPPSCRLNLSGESTHNQVSLRWSTSNCEGITHYDYRYKLNSQSNWPTWSNIGTSTSKTQSGLESDTKYDFTVCAEKNSQSLACDSRTITTPPRPCSPGSVSLTTTSPEVGKPVTATLTDSDGGITGASWTWHRFPSAQSVASTPYPELSSYTPTPSDVGKRLQASVRYRDNCKPEDNANNARSSRTAPVKAASGKPVRLQAMPDSVLAAIAAPNPFNPTTTLHIQLPATGPVSLTIYNMAGQVVRTLWNHHVLEAGYHTIDWDSRDQQGHPVTSGVYLYQLRTRQQVLMNKMVLIR